VPARNVRRSIIRPVRERSASPERGNAGRGATGSPGRRAWGRGGIDATENDWGTTTHERYSTIHLVSADRHLTLQMTSRVSESEHIATHGTVDGSRDGIAQVFWTSDSMDPLTLGPCCSKTSSKSALSVVPRHIPGTSTVTSVRSIQSVLAQPKPPRTNPVAKSTRATVLISSSRRRARGRGWIDALKRDWVTATK
jgi:hypothetical protein